MQTQFCFKPGGLRTASLRGRKVANDQLFFLFRIVGPKKRIESSHRRIVAPANRRTGESSHRRIVAPANRRTGESSHLKRTQDRLPEKFQTAGFPCYSVQTMKFSSILRLTILEGLFPIYTSSSGYKKSKLAE
ncbi:MAG: hypothetical protein ACI9A7_000722 [Cyclobacteriaceae bacterium]